MLLQEQWNLEHVWFPPPAGTTGAWLLFDPRAVTVLSTPIRCQNCPHGPTTSLVSWIHANTHLFPLWDSRGFPLKKGFPAYKEFGGLV